MRGVQVGDVVRDMFPFKRMVRAQATSIDGALTDSRPPAPPVPPQLQLCSQSFVFALRAQILVRVARAEAPLGPGGGHEETTGVPTVCRNV